MRIESSFLRSTVARRVFWVLLAAALLPLLLFASLAQRALGERMEATLHDRLHESAKFAGLQVYDRLVLAQTALAAQAHSRQDGSLPSAAPLGGRALFRGLATVRHDDGRVDGSAELAQTWQGLDTAADAAVDGETDTGQRRRLWWQPATESADTRVLLGVRDETRWWVAELEPKFVWGDLRDADALVSTCVNDADGQVLSCPQDSSSAAEPADGAALRTVSWSLFTRGAFGSPDWVFTAQSAQSGLHFGQLPLEELAGKALLFSALLVMVLSLVLVRRTTQPLERLLEGTRRLANRDWAARVDVRTRDEFGELAGSFNQMAGRIERQMESLQVQSAIDREILSGLDLPRVLLQVRQRLGSLVPGARVALLVRAEDPAAWQWVEAPGDAARPGLLDGSSMDPSVAAAAVTTAAPAGPRALPGLTLPALEQGPVTLHGPAAQRLLRALAWAGEPADRPEAPPADDPQALLVPAVAEGHTRAVLVTLGAALPDADTQRELTELGDRLAVMLVAAEREQQLRARAVRDSLTGLLNRAGLIERIEQRLRPEGFAPFVLAFVDLDGFKAVNDRYGHPVGDALLCRVASLLQQWLPVEATVARPGGDEFVLLLPDGREASDGLAQRLCARLAQPLAVAGHTLHVGASLGLVRCPDDGREHVELMRKADLAMYAAKAAGRSRHAWFDAGMDERAALRAWVQADLALALRRDDQLCLHYQPRVHANSGRLASVEALLRWQHPQRGLISPLQFVPLAEETGQILALGHWVLEAACRQMRRWQDDGLPVPKVAVNVSVLQLTPEFPAEVLGLLRRHGLQPAHLELELTESLFAGDPEAVCALLAPLRDAGMQLALDDFGTGYSSLSALHRLPVGVLKIDRSFVCELAQRGSADAVARSIVALARALGKQTVAEGVETEAQQAMLLGLGCDELQGYLFSRPLSARALEDWIAATLQTA